MAGQWFAWWFHLTRQPGALQTAALLKACKNQPSLNQVTLERFLSELLGAIGHAEQKQAWRPLVQKCRYSNMLLWEIT